MLVPCTVAVNWTVVGFDDVLTDTEAGATGTDATVTRIGCWPPLPGAWAMHPARGSRTAATTNRETAEGKKVRTGPSDTQKDIKKECLGKERGV